MATSPEKFTIYLNESDMNALLLMIFPDYRAEMMQFEHMIGDYILLKKALIMGRLAQFQTIRNQLGDQFSTETIEMIISQTFKPQTK